MAFNYMPEKISNLYIHGTFIKALNFIFLTLANQTSLTFMVTLNIKHIFTHSYFWKTCCIRKGVDSMNFLEDTRLMYELGFSRMNKKTGENFKVM